MLGAVLVAGTAWFRMTANMVWGDIVREEIKPLWWRRSFVTLGAVLLVVGFGLQIWATTLQMP